MATANRMTYTAQTMTKTSPSSILTPVPPGAAPGRPMGSSWLVALPTSRLNMMYGPSGREISISTKISEMRAEYGIATPCMILPCRSKSDLVQLYGRF